MDITGRIDSIGPTQTIGQNGFTKREFVVEHIPNNPEYPEWLKFEFVKDKCQIMDQYQVGMEVQVFFDVRGRKWTGSDGVEKIFTSLQAWRIQQVGAQSTAPSHNAAASVQPAPQPGPTPQTQQMLANAGMTATVQNPPPSTQADDGIPF